MLLYQRRFILLVVLLVSLIAFSGCASDVKFSGPTFSWRSGAGKGPANAIASQPIGGHAAFMGSGSAAANSPLGD